MSTSTSARSALCTSAQVLTEAGLWEWKVEAQEVYYSKRYKELLGYAEHEFLNQFEEFESRLHTDDHDRVMQAIHAHLDSGSPFDVELRLRKRCGEYSWFRCRGQATRDQDGAAELIRLADRQKQKREQGN